MLRNKITLYIFIALLAGVLVGLVYHNYLLNADALKAKTTADTAARLSTTLKAERDTASVNYKAIRAAIKQTLTEKTKAEKAIDSKLELYALMSKIFLKLIKMIIAPLVFTTLVVGVAKVGDIGAVGRIGTKTMLWFITASLVSLLLGMVLVNLYQPGSRLNIKLPDAAQAAANLKPADFSLSDFADHFFTDSIFQSLATNAILQIVVFALFFGVGTAAIGEQGKIIIKAMDAIAHVVMKITAYVMNLAPLAVFGSITVMVAKQGLGILSTYALFISEFYSGLLLLWLVIIGAGFLVLRKRVFTLVANIKDAMLIAFGTSTSEAAYPRVLIELERFGCKEQVVSFVLPLGYSFNLDGSMMYMTFASLFIAQAYNVHLSWAQQISMLLILMLTSKGVAGVPRASMVVIAATIASFNIPEAGLALIIGIDPFLDMGRSATNVLGNAMAAAVVNKWEGYDGEMVE